jgi:hypothetical protein
MQKPNEHYSVATIAEAAYGLDDGRKSNDSIQLGDSRRRLGR